MPTENPSTSSRAIRYLRRRERIKAAAQLLLEDIGIWANQSFMVPETDPQILESFDIMQNHIVQFQGYCEGTLEHLDEQHGGQKENEVDIKAAVVGALNSQWMRLRQVAWQRLPNSPYQYDLKALDNYVIELYKRLYRALPQSMRDSVTTNTPIVYLGRSAEMGLFNSHHPNAPALISVPAGALNEPHGRIAVAHEIAHAVFDRFFTCERMALFKKRIEDTLRVQFPTDDHRKLLLRDTMLEWTSEILADCIGVGLVGPAYIDGALSAMAVSEEVVTKTDRTHPLPILRPDLSLYIWQNYLTEMEEWQKDKEKWLASNSNRSLDDLTTDVFDFSRPYLGLYFRATSAISAITIQDVQDELQTVVQALLHTGVSNEVSLQRIIMDCAPNRISSVTFDSERDRAWSKPADKTKPFSLDLADMGTPEEPIPLSFPFICDWAPWLPFCS